MKLQKTPKIEAVDSPPLRMIKPDRKHDIKLTTSLLCTILVAAWTLSGCAQLLPRQTQTVPTPFDTFEAAQLAWEKVVPFETTLADLRQLGFDVHDSANVTLIPYPELVSRLAPNPSVPFAELDAGIQQCILSRMACEAFEFQIARENHLREGSFWGDFLNFRRRTTITGWRFHAMLVVRNGVVLFRNFGGEPKIARTETQRNPLGPLQPAGEIAGSAFRR